MGRRDYRIKQDGRWAYGLILAVLLVFLAFPSWAGDDSPPKEFVSLSEAIPTITLDIRYFGEDNFIGEKIDGYEAPKAYLTVKATEALKKVQEDLAPFGLGLKVFDAYRPQRAVDHFVRWAKNLDDTRMKAKYYPDVDKKNLFMELYIADKSSHSRGSTVDLTIVDLKDSKRQELDMGSGFDLFGPISWPDFPDVSASQRAHRLLLRQTMITHGFVPYPQEWWHFNYKNDPYPDTYFDFSVK